MNLADLLFDPSADLDAIAVHAAGAETTPRELAQQADAIAAALRGAGVAPGNAVGVSLPNGSVLVAALFGVWRAGAVYVPLNPRLPDGERERIVEAVRPAALVRATSDGRWEVEGLAGAATYGDAVALVQLTSGTTGRPKPVLLEHAGILRLLDGVVSALRGGRPPGRPADVSTTPMPNLVPVSLSLWSGIYQVLFAFRNGAAVVLMERFEPAEFAALVERFAIRSVVLPPAAMTMLVDDPRVESLAPLRYVRSITAPLSPLQARRFMDRFDIAVLNSYGQTELGGEIVGWTAADARAFTAEKLGAVGRAHAGVEVRVLGPSGVSLPAGEPGELVVRTPVTVAGYADGSDLSDRLTADGWFRTGDVGRIDPDGFVWIEGRLSDVINRGGLKVFPGEVEEVLRLAPQVADVAVVGVPDERLGEVPWAFVVLADGASMHVEELEGLCRECLAPFKVPVRFERVDALPRNDIGKVLAHELVVRPRQP